MAKRRSKAMESHKAAKRETMLASAKALFVTNGYDATTIRQIVDHAGTSIGNCYFYFQDKDAILLAIIEQTNEEIVSEVETAIADLPIGPVRLAVAIYAGMLATLKRQDIARVAAVEAKHPVV